MLKVQYLSCSQGEWEPGEIPVVHPYYWRSFSVLRGEEGPAQCWNSDNIQFLLEPIRRASVECRQQISCFLNVHTTEEYGAPAPEYLLLDGAGLNHVSPLAIRGMESLALPEALAIAQAQLQKESAGAVLVCCSELPTPYDDWQFRKRSAAAFVVEMSVRCDSPGIRITEYCSAASRQQLLEKLHRFEGTLIYSELLEPASDLENVQVIYGRNGMLEPLLLLDQMRRDGCQSEMLVLLETRGHYGYLHYQLGE